MDDSTYALARRRATEFNELVLSVSNAQRPARIVESLDRLREIFLAGDPSARRILRATLNARALDVMVGYAGELSRSGEVCDISKGLCVLAIADCGNDIRDSLMTLATLRSAAFEISAPATIFVEASRLVEHHQLRQQMISCAASMGREKPKKPV